MFKIGATFQEASICLRCQYRLSLRQRPRPKQPFPRAPLQIRHFEPGRRSFQEQVGVSDVDNYDDVVSKPIITYEPYEPGSKDPQRRKNAYSSVKNSLGVNALGEPAEVLIVGEKQQEANRKRDLVWRSLRPSTEALGETMSSTEMIEEMDAERGIIDIDQVCKNIEAVKGSRTAKGELPWKAAEYTVSSKQYNKFETTLREGFTVRQLAAYLEKTAKLRPVDPMDLHTEYSCSLYARSSWRPGMTDLWGMRAPQIMQGDQEKQGRSSKQGSQKSAIIDRIIRHCWRIRPQEDEAAVGEIDVRLQSPHLELIVNHNRDILKQISERYGAKVEASSHDRVIRVTSDYETSLDILRLIIHTLNNIQSSAITLPTEVDLDSKALKEAHNAIFSQIPESTNTIVKSTTLPESDEKLQFNGTQLQIYYLGPDDEDLENAERLINQILRPKMNERGSIPFAKDSKMIRSRSIQTSKDVLAPIDVGNSLPLIDRPKEWSRWCSTSLRQQSKKGDREDAMKGLNTLENPLDQKNIVRAVNEFFALPEIPYTTAESTKDNWKSNKSYWDTVLLGQVVFLSPAPKGKTKTLKAGKSTTNPQVKLNDPPREFISMVPGLVRSLENFGMEDLRSNPWQEEFLLIRLTPSFKNTIKVPLEIVPDLEIRIFFNESTRTTSIRDVRLAYKDELDLLLPQNTMDLRFVRRTCVYSRKSNGQGLDEKIEEFIRNSRLNIWGNDRLQTPASLSINVPPHALRPLTDGRTTEGFEKHEVEYSFASLEHRSEIGLPFRQPGSWADLAYTGIEGGKIGGRRDELCLRQPRGPKKSNLQEETDENHEKEEDIDETTADDEHHSASLLKKANALINTIEHPPDHLTSQKIQGIGKEISRINEAKWKEANKKSIRRGRNGGRAMTKPARTRVMRNLETRSLKNIRRSGLKGRIPISRVTARARIRKLQI